MKISNINYNNTKAIKVENNKYELIIPLEYGIRIMSFKEKNSFNFLGENIETSRECDNDLWHLRGGHRLWHTPEKFPRTYLPDNEEINYELKDNKLFLAEKVNEKTNIKKQMIIEFIDNGNTLRIEHIITNLGMWDIETAAWGITILKTGGIASVPLNKRKDNLLSTKTFSLWAYCDLSDDRINFKKDLFTVKQDINNKSSFKIGTNNEEGYATYELNGYIFKKAFNYFENEKYPDNGCSFELYTDANVLELETLSPIKRIKVNDKISHIEKWSINKIN